MFHGHHNPRDDIGDQSYSGRNQGQDDPDQPHKGDIHSEVFRNTPTHSGNLLVRSGAHERPGFTAGRAPLRRFFRRMTTLTAVNFPIRQFRSAVGTVHPRLHLMRNTENRRLLFHSPGENSGPLDLNRVDLYVIVRTILRVARQLRNLFHHVISFDYLSEHGVFVVEP